jgi:O-antigen/teichoic acid export membrane protein
MSVRRSFAWAFSGQAVASVIQFTGLIVISRLLTPHEIGIYVIAMATLGLTQVFTTLGIAAFIVREPDLTEQVLASAFTVNTILLAILSLALFAMSFVSGPLLGADEAGSVLRVLSASNLLAIATFRPMAMLQREMQFKTLSIVAVSNTSVQTLSTIAFAVAGASYMSAPYAFVVSGLVTIVLTNTLGRRFVSVSMSMKSWRPIVTFGLKVMSVSGVAIITGRVSELLVGRILGISALGLYGRASQLSSMIFENVYGTATRIVFPQLSKDFRESGDWQGTYLRSMAMITAVMWPFLAGLAVLARPAVNLLYGPQWLPTASPLSALLAGQIIGIAFGMNWELFVLRGEIGRQARYEITRLSFGLPIFALGCTFGLTGAGLAGTFTALVGFIVYYPQINRLAELGPTQMPAIYWRSGLLTVAAVLPSVILMTVWRWSAETPLLLVGAAVVSGIILWLIAIARTDHPLWQEIKVLFARFDVPHLSFKR